MPRERRRRRTEQPSRMANSIDGGPRKVGDRNCDCHVYIVKTWTKFYEVREMNEGGQEQFELSSYAV